MMRAALALAFALAAAALGCPSSGDKASSAETPQPAASATGITSAAASASAPAAAERTRCASDADCINSCSQGAVSKRWYEGAFPGDESCEDGCASKHAAAPRCLASACVAFDRAGERVPFCTNRRAPIEKIGPAHRCARAEECINTCEHGAVNRDWYSWGARLPKCKDGCARDGFEAPRCEDGGCLAIFDGKLDRGCTRKPIW